MGKLLYFPKQTRTDQILDLCAYHQSGLREAIASTEPSTRKGHAMQQFNWPCLGFLSAYFILLYLVIRAIIG